MRDGTPVSFATGEPPVPMVCADLELADPRPPSDVPMGHGIRYLVRLHGEPLGFVSAQPAEVSHGVEPCVDRAFDAFTASIRAHLRSDDETVPEEARRRVAVASATTCTRQLTVRGVPPSAAIVVPTVGTHPLLRACVTALLEQDYVGSFEVIVVDNRPTTGRVVQALAGLSDPRLRVVLEPVPGASRARNAGASSTSAEIVAFTDDDAVADPHWLTGCVAVLMEDHGIAATTGLVIAGSLTTAAEIWFEDCLGFSKGFERVVWSVANSPSQSALGNAGQHGLLFPFRATLFGSGNSMCFRRAALHEVGGFDTRLGPGTPALGGEDLDVYVKMLLRGHTLVYEPRTFVRHFHRSSTDELSHQMYDYGLGLTAYLTHEAVNHPRAFVASMMRGAVRRRPASVGTDQRKPPTDAFPELSAQLWRLNHRGMLHGPGAYLRSLRGHRMAKRE